MFKNAELIFTGTFHGTVFSIKSQKQFFNYLTNKSRIKKVKSLLNEFNINHREEILSNKKINYSIVNKKIEEEIKKSLNFIKSNIEYEKR